VSAPSVSPTKSFALPDNAIRWRPLWPKATAQIFLNLNEYEMEKALQDGRLAWIFNIGGDNHKRKELRVLAYSVFECAGMKVEGITPTANLTLEQVAKILFGQRTVLRSVEVARVFFCERKHIHKLESGKLLTVASQPEQRLGPNSSTRITRESLVRFLERRRIT
jgi:hypothetical protein